MKALKDVTKGARSTQCELLFDFSMTREIDNIHERMRIRDYLIGKFSKTPDGVERKERYFRTLGKYRFVEEASEKII